MVRLVGAPAGAVAQVEGFGRWAPRKIRKGFLNAQKYRMGTCCPLRSLAGNGRTSAGRGQDSRERVLHVRHPDASERGSGAPASGPLAEGARQAGPAGV